MIFCCHETWTGDRNGARDAHFTDAIRSIGKYPLLLEHAARKSSHLAISSIVSSHRFDLSSPKQRDILKKWVSSGSPSSSEHLHINFDPNLVKLVEMLLNINIILLNHPLTPTRHLPTGPIVMSTRFSHLEQSPCCCSQPTSRDAPYLLLLFLFLFLSFFSSSLHRCAPPFFSLD